MCTFILFIRYSYYYMHSRNKISFAFIWDGKTNDNSKTVQFTVQKFYIHICENSMWIMYVWCCVVERGKEI